MDYQTLLRKYIAHVEFCAGENFLDHLDDSAANVVRFDDDEIAALLAERADDA